MHTKTTGVHRAVMDIKAILKRCHPIKGFIYEKVGLELTNRLS